MKNVKHILISFVGSNDAGKLKGPNDGAILTALQNQKFDEVILLWNKSGSRENDYNAISNYLKNEIKKRKLARKTELVELSIKDVTNHNQIYLLLKNYTDILDKSEENIYTAAISSGTPAMQVCWILLAESGDFSDSNQLKLIQIKDPKFGKSENVPVKIDTSLPKIVRLKEEVETLKKDLIPAAKILMEKAQLKIGEVEIILSPIELSYYIYFAEIVISGKVEEKFSGYNTKNVFLARIIEIHKQLYPDLDSNRMELENILKRGIGLALSTFRGNISKVNKKIKEALNNESIANTFEISSNGNRGAKFYGVKAPKEKIEILK